MKTKLLLLVLCLLVFSVAVQAIPGGPMQIKGTVITNGHAAADNIIITSIVEGEDATAEVTQGGVYGTRPANVFIIQDLLNNRAGKTVEIFVGDVKATEFIFESGIQKVVDLSVTGDFPAPNTNNDNNNNNNNGGGSPLFLKGSSGGGLPPPSDDTEENETNETITTVVLEDEDEIIVETDAACQPSWTCSDWLDCVNGKQRRVCVDAFSCGTEAEKPVTERTCEVVKEAKQENFFTKVWNNIFSGENQVTGEAIKTTNTGSIVAVIIAAIIVAGVLVFAFRKQLFGKK